jgi:hypothetical protein
MVVATMYAVAVIVQPSSCSISSPMFIIDEVRSQLSIRPDADLEKC